LKRESEHYKPITSSSKVPDNMLIIFCPNYSSLIQITIDYKRLVSAQLYLLVHPGFYRPQATGQFGLMSVVVCYFIRSMLSANRTADCDWTRDMNFDVVYKLCIIALKSVVVTFTRKCPHRRRSSVNFGGGHEKLTKWPTFSWYLPEKLKKNSRILHDTCICPKKLTKYPNFTRFLPEKIVFARIWGGGQLPCLPVSYADECPVISVVTEEIFVSCVKQLYYGII